MKKSGLLIIGLSFFLVGVIRAEGFEGNITFVRNTIYDTIFYSMSVQKNLVRIDERNAHKQISQSIILDLKTEKITAISPLLKMYTTIEPRQNCQRESGSFEVIKTTNFKIINGLKCYQWRLRNKQMNSEITYWVHDCSCEFFERVVSLLGRSGDYARYCNFFQQMPDTGGFIPMEAVERTMVRGEKSRLTLQKINQCKVDGKMFRIPKDYKLLRT